MDVSAEGKHLCLIICSRSVGVCDPFLVPFLKRTGVLAEGVHGLGRRHLRFNRDEVSFESGAEVIPAAKVGVCKG